MYPRNLTEPQPRRKRAALSSSLELPRAQPGAESTGSRTCAPARLHAFETLRHLSQGYDEFLYMQNVVKKNIRPSVPEWWPSDFREVVQSCWDPIPFKRMSLAVAATRLRQMRKAHENGTAEAAPPPAQCSCAVS